MDPASVAVISKITGEAGKRLVQRGIDKVTKRAQKIDDRISESFEVLGKEIRISCKPLAAL